LQSSRDTGSQSAGLQDLTLTDRKGKIFHLSDRTGPVLQHQTDDQKIMIFQGGSINAKSCSTDYRNFPHPGSILRELIPDNKINPSPFLMPVPWVMMGRQVTSTSTEKYIARPLLPACR
jgi:hypothetical protein